MKFLNNEKFTLGDLKKAALHAYRVAAAAIDKNNDLRADTGQAFLRRRRLESFLDIKNGDNKPENIIPMKQLPDFFVQIGSQDSRFKRTITVLAKVFYTVNKENLQLEEEDEQVEDIIYWIDNTKHSSHMGNAESKHLNEKRYPHSVLKKAAIYVFEEGKEEMRSYYALREELGEQLGKTEAAGILAKMQTFEAMTSPRPVIDFWGLETVQLEGQTDMVLKKAVALMAKQLQAVKKAEEDLMSYL